MKVPMHGYVPQIDPMFEAKSIMNLSASVDKNVASLQKQLELAAREEAKKDALAEQKRNALMTATGKYINSFENTTTKLAKGVASDVPYTYSATDELAKLQANYLSQLKNRVDSGQATLSDFTKAGEEGMALVSNAQAAEKLIQSLTVTFTDAAAEKNISNAQDPNDMSAFVQAGPGRGIRIVGYKKNDDGQIVLNNGVPTFLVSWPGIEEDPAEGDYKDSEGTVIREWPISQLDRLPTVLKKPEFNAFQYALAESNNKIKLNDQKMSRLQIKDGAEKARQDFTNNNPFYSDGNGLPGTIKLNDKFIKQDVQDAGQDAFNTYFSSLGNGQERTGYKQYILDGIGGIKGSTNDRARKYEVLAKAQDAINAAGYKFASPLPKETMGYDTVNDFVNRVMNHPEEGVREAFQKSLQDDFVQMFATNMEVQNQKRWSEYQAALKPPKSNKESNTQAEIDAIFAAIENPEFAEKYGITAKKDEGLRGKVSQDISKDLNLFNEAFGIDLSEKYLGTKGDALRYSPIGGGKVNFSVDSSFDKTLEDVFRYKFPKMSTFQIKQLIEERYPKIGTFNYYPGDAEDFTNRSTDYRGINISTTK